MTRLRNDLDSVVDAAVTLFSALDTELKMQLLARNVSVEIPQWIR